MKSTEYIVIGKYSHEQNSWIPGGDIRHHISGHRTESAAWASADEAHDDLGGCDGSNALAEVMRRFARLGSKKATTVGDDQNTFEHAGYLYVECDFWNAHEVTVFSGGLGYKAIC